MGGVQNTDENLQAAIEGEGFEFQQMYPKFLAEAEAENNKPAVFSFKYALAVEEIHHGLYTEALEAVTSGTDLPESKIFVCAVCGNTVKGEAPDKCPICGAAHEQFNEIAD
jgi:rubrerythrin